jgi:hypothetical protein
VFDCSKVLQKLRLGPRIAWPSLADSPRQQGAYVLWLDCEPPVCLKVGIAGPRRGEGLWGRLKLHYASNSANSVLARHLAADSTSPWARDYDFRDREQRKNFLTQRCCFQAIALPTMSLGELRWFEGFLERELRPKYAGRVDKSK